MVYPYNYKFGQRIQTNVDGVAVDRAFLAHIQVAAEDAVALSADGVLSSIALGEATQEITEGINNPAVPRALSIVGNVSGIIGDMVLTGKNYAGEEIEETVVLNGTATVNGAKAFKEITNISLPVQVHTPVQQTETIEVTNGCTADGDITVTVTAAALGASSPADVVVALNTTDHATVTAVAAAVVAALNADGIISAAFTADNVAGVITLTANEPAADDATLEIAFAVGSTGVTVGASTNGAAGVPYDIISVGWNDILGLPYKLAHNTVLAAYLDNVLEGTAPTVAVSAAVLESNTINLNSALDGTVVDIYLII